MSSTRIQQAKSDEEIINEIANIEHAKRQAYAHEVERAKQDHYQKAMERAKQEKNKKEEEQANIENLGKRNSPLHMGKPRVTSLIRKPEREEMETQVNEAKKEKKIDKKLGDEERRQILKTILAKKNQNTKLITTKSPKLFERMVDDTVVIVHPGNLNSYLRNKIDPRSDIDLPSPGL
jgi:hypothetical protein